MKTVTIIFIILAIGTAVLSQDCNVKLTQSGVVCVCNSSYCDAIPPLQPLVSTKYQVYTTSKTKLGLDLYDGSFADNTGSEGGSITIDRSKTYQKIIGFGGAFTDSTGINVLSLPEQAQDKLLESYYGETGSSYSLGRVPIGGTDFSTRPYTYDDNPGDVTLEKFALQQEDLTYKIPLIKKAEALRGNGEFKLYASAWTSPSWMKTNNATTGKSALITEYYQLWADYAIKFFDSYAENGIQFWGITTGNEPFDGFFDPPLISLPDLGWTPEQANQWISENLGPTIRNSSYKDVKIILLDGNRIALPFMVPLLLNTPETLQYADGVGVHWYFDNLLPWSLLDLAKTDKKDIFLLHTEACNGFRNMTGDELAVDLGSWERGAKYIESILTYLDYGASGWTDWNMVLNTDGGPTFINNYLDSPIIVNATAGEFYKQPMYYVFAHFAKFAVPDSVKIEATLDDLPGVKSVAFNRPDDTTVVIMYNSNPDYVHVRVVDSSSKAELTLNPDSISTLIYGSYIQVPASFVLTH